MTKLEWKYVSPLKEDTTVEILELKYHFMIPDDLKECIIKNNAGVPSLSAFDFGENNAMVFGGLLSFNEGETDSFFDYVNIFEKEDGKSLKMFPFALDPAGNFFCVENGKIVLYKHEEDRTIVICDTFSDFLNMLY